MTILCKPPQYKRGGFFEWIQNYIDKTQKLFYNNRIVVKIFKKRKSLFFCREIKGF